jgi:hypothetical protein
MRFPLIELDADFGGPFCVGVLRMSNRKRSRFAGGYRSRQKSTSIPVVIAHALD